MKILSAVQESEGAFIIIEDEGRAFVYVETPGGYHVFSTEADWSKVVAIKKFVAEMFEQGSARFNAPISGGVHSILYHGDGPSASSSINQRGEAAHISETRSTK